MSQPQPGPSAAPGAISPDGAYIWNGTHWIPNAPGQAVPAKKKGHFWRNGAIGCGGIIALLVVIGIAAGGGSSSSSSSTSSSPAVKSSPVASSPKAANDPHALTVANVTQSIHDNSSYTVADLTGLEVQITDGVITVWTKPGGDETAVFNATASNAYTVSRATQSGWYKGVTEVIVRTRVDITDKFGKASVDDSMFIDIKSTTAAQFSYDGLAGRVLSDPVQMFCLGDDSNIPLYILNHIPTAAKNTWLNC